jgi:acylphosphatase
MQIRAKIIINGKVQMVGFRTFIKNSADSFDIKGFAENLPDGTVKIVCEGEKAKITDFISYIKQESPSFAVIDDINIEYGSYKGEFSTFKRQGADVPSDDGAVLAVLKSFDAKAETMVAILGSMNEKLGSIDDKQDKTIGILKDVNKDTSAMRDKQGETIGILKDVKEDTKYIPGIKDDTSELLGKQDKAMEILDSVKQDTGEMTDTLTFLKAVYRETLELKEKYEVLSRDVAAIKVKLKAG